MRPENKYNWTLEDWKQELLESDMGKTASPSELKLLLRSVELAFKICQSIKNSSKSWERDRYTFEHKKSGACFWIANGEYFFAPYDKAENNMALHIDKRVCKKMIYPVFVDWCLDITDVFVESKSNKNKVSLFTKFKLRWNHMFNGDKDMKLLEYKPEDKMDLV